MLTLRQLASHKRLPVDFLTGLGLCQCSDGVEMPYYDLAGEHPIYKLRTALSAGQGSLWPKDCELRPYGEWRLDDARRRGELILVEGESDSWALWHHGYPCLGIPGANAAGCLTVEHIYGISRIWISREPDQGGQKFVSDCTDRLAHLGYAGYVQDLRFIHCKDASEVHIRCADTGQNFKKAMDYLLFTAPWVDMTVARNFVQQAAAIARLEQIVYRQRKERTRS